MALCRQRRCVPFCGNKNCGKERYTSHAIGWKTLNQLVLEDIRRNAQVASLAAEDYMNMLVSMKTEKSSGD